MVFRRPPSIGVQNLHVFDSAIPFDSWVLVWKAVASPGGPDPSERVSGRCRTGHAAVCVVRGLCGMDCPCEGLRDPRKTAGIDWQHGTHGVGSRAAARKTPAGLPGSLTGLSVSTRMDMMAADRDCAPVWDVFSNSSGL